MYFPSLGRTPPYQFAPCDARCDPDLPRATPRRNPRNGTVTTRGANSRPHLQQDHHLLQTHHYLAVAMDDQPAAEMPPDLRLRILALLPPNEVALAGRLTCKDAAQRFSQPHHRTVHLNQQLPPYSDACLAASLRHWPLRHTLWLLVGSPRCGREEGVEAVWRAVQPRLFPEFLRTDHYLQLLHQQPGDEGKRLWVTIKEEIGSAAVAGGLAHMLPSLAQRCPGLIDPGRTLEAAARHCDLAELQAAWELLGHRLLSQLDTVAPVLPEYDDSKHCSQAYERLEGMLDTWYDDVHGVWGRLLVAAAGSPNPDALPKMAWAYDLGRTHCHFRARVDHPNVWGAAAASGDLARMQWLSSRGFQWGGHQERVADLLRVVLRDADLGFLQNLEHEGGYLPRAGDAAWRSEEVFAAAAASPRDSAAKLLWLAGRGAALGSPAAGSAAAQHGNLEALQLLQLHAGRGKAAATRGAAGPSIDTLAAAVESGSIPTAAWLRQEGCALRADCFRRAFRWGDLPMVTWLLQAGCPRIGLSLCDAVRAWPSSTPADSEALVEAVRLLRRAGWPEMGPNRDHALTAVAERGHAWGVWCAMRELLPANARKVPQQAAACAAAAGCEATLKALVGMGMDTGVQGGGLATGWYAAAAKNGDLGTLSCLRRLGVPLGEGVVAATAKAQAPVQALAWLMQQGAPAVPSVDPGVFLGVLTGLWGPRDRVRLGLDARLEHMLALPLGVAAAAASARGDGGRQQPGIRGGAGGSGDRE